MARLQRPHLGGDPEQLADEILEMRREIDEQVRISALLDAPRDRAAPSSAGHAARHRPRPDARQTPDRADQAVPVIKIGEREPVLKDEVGH